MKTMINLFLIGVVAFGTNAFAEKRSTELESIYKDTKKLKKCSMDCFEKAIEIYEKYKTINGDRSGMLHNYKAEHSIVLIHSFTRTNNEMSQYLSYLHNKGANVLSINLAGHGPSELSLSNLSPKRWYEDMDFATVLASHLGNKVSLLGYSNGGLLAVRTAAASAYDSEMIPIHGVALVAPELEINVPMSGAACMARPLIRSGIADVISRNFTSNGTLSDYEKEFLMGGCAVQKVISSISRISPRRVKVRGERIELTFAERRKIAYSSLSGPVAISYTEDDFIVTKGSLENFVKTFEIIKRDIHVLKFEKDESVGHLAINNMHLSNKDGINFKDILDKWYAEL